MTDTDPLDIDALSRRTALEFIHRYKRGRDTESIIAAAIRKAFRDAADYHIAGAVGAEECAATARRITYRDHFLREAREHRRIADAIASFAEKPQ